LAGNRLRTLPAEIGKLADLVELDVSSNLLERLPEGGIGRLAKLGELYLQDNQLSALPADLDGLVALAVLDVRNVRRAPALRNGRRLVCGRSLT